MSIFVFELKFSASRWEQLIEDPGPLLHSFDRELQSDSGDEPSESLLIWPSEGTAWFVVQGSQSIPDRIVAATDVIGAEHARGHELPSTLPSREEQPQQWLNAVVGSAPLEGQRCGGCGRTRPPHAVGCKFSQQGEAGLVLEERALPIR